MDERYDDEKFTFYWSVIAYDATPTILAPDPGLSVPEPTPKRTPECSLIDSLFGSGYQ